MVVTEKAIPNELARSKDQEKKMKLKMTTTGQVNPIDPVRAIHPSYPN